MMTTGFETALGEITLVLFTTLAPSGVLGFSIMAGALAFGWFDRDVRSRINQFLCIPLMISMVGLIASATHLGNPANALYVFMGVGRSPLSTEVFCAVIFLFLAGVYWLYSFSRRQIVGLQRAWSVAIIAAGIAFVTAVAFAYDAETIVSWNTAYVPIGLWLNAVVGGPLVALLSFRAAKAEAIVGRYGSLLCGVSAVALVLNTAVYAMQGTALAGIENSFGTAADLVPFYGLAVAAFFVLCTAGVLSMQLAVRAGRVPDLARAAVSCALAYGGIFVMRFVFYMMHMTIGLGF